MADNEFRTELIMMCGTSGSGKTHFSRIIECNGYVRLSLDEEMWNSYGSGYFSWQPERQMSAQKEMSEVIYNKAAHLLAKNKSVVVDWCFCKRFQRDRWRALAEKNNAAAVLLYCSAPRDLLLERLRKRDGNPAPNSAHVTEEMLDRFLCNFEYPEKDEEATDASVFCKVRNFI